jgi:hypothetical protein
MEIVTRLINPTESGASVASLTKQLRETLAAALDTSDVVVADPLDELRARRDRKRRIGGR